MRGICLLLTCGYLALWFNWFNTLSPFLRTPTPHPHPSAGLRSYRSTQTLHFPEQPAWPSSPQREMSRSPVKKIYLSTSIPHITWSGLIGYLQTAHSYAHGTCSNKHNQTNSLNERKGDREGWGVKPLQGSRVVKAQHTQFSLFWLWYYPSVPSLRSLVGCDKLLASGSVVWEKRIEEQTEQTSARPTGWEGETHSHRVHTQASATSTVDKSVFSDVFCISPFSYLLSLFITGLNYI